MSKRNPKSAWETGQSRTTRWRIELTDVNQTSVSVNHDVTVVTILDLYDVAEERVGGHRLDEVVAGLLEVDAVGTAVLEDEEAAQVVDLGTSHLVSGRRVGNNVDDTTLGGRRGQLMSKEEQRGDSLQVQSQ
jgi:hypothetical protein